MFADLRGFSSWVEKYDLSVVSDLMQAQMERVVQICNDHHHHFHKFLGDGFVLLWEADETLTLKHCLAHSLDAAFHLHKKYWYLSGSSRQELPSGYGIGIATGEAIRVQPETFLAETNEVDFLGYPLNCAARLQTLAAAYGTVVCSQTAALLTGEMARLLYPNTAGFRRILEPPSAAGLMLASALKGLRPLDRDGHRYLRFVDSERVLWRTSGQLDDVPRS